MAMTLQSRRELYKLRELINFLLQGAGGSKRGAQGEILCAFCEKRLDEGKFIAHGNSVGPKFEGGLTIHHLDGNHDNNGMENKALCHTSCHKSYHRRLANLLRNAHKEQK